MTAVTNSTLAFYGRSQLFLGGLRADAETLQRQVSTGERIERSSDDPVAASRLRTLGRIETLGQIDAAKAQRVDEDLTLATDALSSVADDLIRVRELALWASTQTTGSSEHDAIATEIEQLRARIFATANTLDSGGRPLFGGTSGTAAYQQDGAGNVSYVGTASTGDIDLGQGQSVTRGLAGGGAGPADRTVAGPQPADGGRGRGRPHQCHRPAATGADRAGSQPGQLRARRQSDAVRPDLDTTSGAKQCTQ